MEKNSFDIMQYRIVRKIDDAVAVSLRTVLIDRGNEHLVVPGETFLVVPAEDWYVVQQWENAIFVDEHGELCYFYTYYIHFEPRNIGIIQLVVLRGVGAGRLDVLSYICGTVIEAAHDRRTVRVCGQNLYSH
jgi:hypothetical protein